MYDLSFHDLDSRVKYKEMQVYTASIYSLIPQHYYKIFFLST